MIRQSSEGNPIKHVSVPKTMAMQTQLCKKIFCLIDFLKKKKKNL